MPAKPRPTQNSAPEIICQSSDDVKRVTALSDYCLEVELFDGTAGTVFMKELIFRQSAGVFAALRDPVVFNQVFFRIWCNDLAR